MLTGLLSIIVIGFCKLGEKDLREPLAARHPVVGDPLEGAHMAPSMAI